jgi:hypothetical protein
MNTRLRRMYREETLSSITRHYPTMCLHYFQTFHRKYFTSRITLVFNTNSRFVLDRISAGTAAMLLGIVIFRSLSSTMKVQYPRNPSQPNPVA